MSPALMVLGLFGCVARMGWPCSLALTSVSLSARIHLGHVSYHPFAPEPKTILEVRDRRLHPKLAAKN